MRETGEPFDVIAADGSGDRHTLEPVPLFGRAVGGDSPFQKRPWSTWRYRVRDRPQTFVEPDGAYELGDRPQRFRLTYDGADASRLMTCCPESPDRPDNPEPLPAP